MSGKQTSPAKELRPEEMQEIEAYCVNSIPGAMIPLRLLQRAAGHVKALEKINGRANDKIVALISKNDALLREVEALRGALAESREALNYYAELHPVSESAITQSMTAREAIAEIDAALSRRAVGEVDSAQQDAQGGAK